MRRTYAESASNVGVEKIMTQQTFDDFDEFAAAVREVDCTMMVQNAEIHEWTLQIAEAGKVEVQSGKLGRRDSRSDLSCELG